MCDPRQINTHTHPHMHTLWYKRICQAPTLYTCKTNGLQYPHSNITVTPSFPKDAALHTCQNGNTNTQAACPLYKSAFMCLSSIHVALVLHWSLCPPTLQVALKEYSSKNLLFWCRILWKCGGFFCFSTDIGSCSQFGLTLTTKGYNREPD